MPSNKTLAVELPHNLEAEKACLGSALENAQAASKVTSNLVESDFYIGKHQIIFRAIYNLLYNKHQSAEVVTVTDELINMKELENIGGVPYLKECMDATVSIGAIDYYIKAVNDQSVLRSMLNTIHDIDNQYKTGGIEDINQFIIDSEAQFRDSISRRKVSDFEAIRDVGVRVRNILKTATRTNLMGVSTGYTSIDEVTRGLPRKGMVVVAGRPGMGKTAFALNLAYRVATRNRCSVGFFSLEMSKEELFQRLLASEGNVELGKIMSNDLNDQERSNLASAVSQIGESKIYIDDSRGSPLTDIMAKSRNLANTVKDLGLIIVDHIGIIGDNKNMNKNDSRQDIVRKLSAGLRALAGELDIPIVVLCQINRKVDERDNPRPLLSDLRESGAIEADADIVMFLYRDDFYKQRAEEKKNKNNNKPAEEKKQYEKDKDLADAGSLPGSPSYLEVIIAKNRNGQQTTRGLFFYKAYQRIDLPPVDWVDSYNNYNN